MALLEKSVNELINFFETSEHPHIMWEDRILQGGKDQSLITNGSCYTEQQCFDILEGVIKGVSELKAQLFDPVEVQIRHIVGIQGRWCLRGVICWSGAIRATFEPEVETWKPFQVRGQIEEHEKYLVTHLGLLWIGLLSGKSLKNLENGKKQLETLRCSPKLRELLKKMLVQIGNFSDLLVTLSIEYPQRFSYSQKSEIIKDISKIRKDIEETNLSPYQQQVFLRKMKQLLVMDEFMTQFKTELPTIGILLKIRQKAINFTKYMINLKLFSLYRRIKEEAEKIGHFNLIAEGRAIYCEILSNLVHLREQIISENQKSHANLDFAAKFGNCGQDNPDEVDSLNIDFHYKSVKFIPMQFISDLISDIRAHIRRNEETVSLAKILVKLVIARTIEYVFDKCRSYLFAGFFQGTFHLQQVLARIEACENSNQLVALSDRIINYYFQSPEKKQSRKIK